MLTFILCIATLVSNVGHGIVGCYAINNDTGEICFEENSDLSLVPASSLKIVTTGAALELLGPDYLFETKLEYDGYIKDKELYGNVYIHGAGDPCLGFPDWKKQIDAWTNAIDNLGIKEIKGKIIADDSKWERALAPPSWSWEDLGNYYGAGASALSFHNNEYTLSFKPGDYVGAPTTIIETDPPQFLLTLHNEVLTGEKGSGDQACIYGSEYSSNLFVRGTIPFGVDSFSIYGAILDPSLYVSNLLTRELQAKGIIIKQETLPQQTDRIPFHTTQSPPLHEIIYATHQGSINLYAEHLLKTLGELQYNEGSTRAGIKAVTEFWRSKNIDLTGFSMADASGLSRKNLITAKQFVAILLYMKQSDDFAPFFNSLPLLTDSIRAKSGSMTFIRSYAGYGENITFAILTNNWIDSQISREKIASLLSKLE